ncbi:glycoside hydrolase family 95 protein [Nocardioides fonticola]|uniref:Glycoside hydrolase family 95 protein n=1 Tax=Nocardioides fonticola TaxID=450363 RepID=A0ABP7XGT8_9ACTN
MNAPQRMRYLRPARRWTDALPLGNGRIGAMVFGGVGLERIQVNDDRAWSGSPATGRGTPLLADGEGPRVLAEVRAALLEGDVSRAEKISTRFQHGHSQSFQPLVDLWWATADTEPLDRLGADDYERWLDLEQAIAGHTACSGGVRWQQEAWASAPRQVLVVRRWAASGVLPPTDLRLSSPHPTGPPSSWQEATGRVRVELVVPMPAHVVPPHEQLPEPIRYDESAGAVTCVVLADIVTDGRIALSPTGARITEAREIAVVLTTEADYRGPLTRPHGDVGRLRARAGHHLGAVHDAARGGWDAVRAEHVADHRRLFDRVGLHLGPPPAADAVPRPVEQLLAAGAPGAPDPELVALAFQYGRYLLVAGSRPGTLPLTLQGVWNEKQRPPWSSNYTTNINVEMNYWPAEVAALPETHLALLDWMHQVAPRGAEVARTLYGASGWTLHHNSDAWGFAWPAGEGDADPCWSFWPLGAAWLCRHVWEHFDFTGDVDRLAHDFPLVRGAVEFVLDWLVELPDGSLGTVPSTSPENRYLHDDGPRALSVTTTSDLQLAGDLLARFLEIAALLADRVVVAPELIARARAASARLPVERVMADGRLAEWSDDPVDAEPEHRHTSHLLGVYPLQRIAPASDPALAAAAHRSLDARGPRSTGWALAWRIALRARLRDPAGAGVALAHFLAPMAPDASEEPSMTAPAGVYTNLFCAHPPFQIDGNLGFTAGVAELLLDSHADHLAARTDLLLLPSPLPEWHTGAFRGLRARGGLSVDLTWRDLGASTEHLEATVHARRARQVRLTHRDDVVEAALADDAVVRWSWHADAGWVRH